MKFAILTQDDGIFSYDLVKPFVKIFNESNDHIITSINLSRSRAVGRQQTIKKKLLLTLNTFGYKFVLFSICKYIYNSLVGRSVKTLADKAHLPLYKLIDGVNSSRFRERMVIEQVDIVVIIAGTEIVKRETLHAPNLGFINCHSSILPADKGLMPVFWSLLSNRTGFTWYSLDEGIDTGKILLQQRVQVERSFVKQLITTKEQAASRLFDAVKVLTNDNKPVLLKVKNGSYNKFPSREDVSKFKDIIRLF